MHTANLLHCLELWPMATATTELSVEFFEHGMCRDIESFQKSHLEWKKISMLGNIRAIWSLRKRVVLSYGYQITYSSFIKKNTNLLTVLMLVYSISSAIAFSVKWRIRADITICKCNIACIDSAVGNIPVFGSSFTELLIYFNKVYLKQAWPIGSITG